MSSLPLSCVANDPCDGGGAGGGGEGGALRKSVTSGRNGDAAWAFCVLALALLVEETQALAFPWLVGI